MIKIKSEIVDLYKNWSKKHGKNKKIYYISKYTLRKNNRSKSKPQFLEFLFL